MPILRAMWLGIVAPYTAIATAILPQNLDAGLLKLTDYTGSSFKVLSFASFTSSLENVEVAFHCGSQWSTTDNGSLEYVSTTRFESFHEVYGTGEGLATRWKTRAGLQINTTVTAYKDQNALVFGQHFPEGCEESNFEGNDLISTSFPTFSSSSSILSQPYLTWVASSEFGAVTGQGYNGTPVSNLNGKPLVYFDTDSFDTILLGPTQNFIAGIHHKCSKKLGAGIMNSVTSLPRGFSHSTILIAGKGIGRTIDSYGILLRSQYNRSSITEAEYMELQFLGYFTNNGAAYYYNIEGNLSYPQTFAAVYEEATSLQIPYKYYHLDSFFYPKEADGKAVCDKTRKHSTGSNGLLVWDGCGQLFPEGLGNLSKNLGGHALTGHSRLFSDQSLYSLGAKPIVGVKPPSRQFDFALDHNHHAGIPLNCYEFFSWLFEDSRARWNMQMYEQDWTATIYEANTILRTNITAGRDWIVGMGNAGLKHNVGVGHGSPWPGGILQMVEAPAARWAFSSPNPHSMPSVASNWRISRPALLLDAIGSAPMKDTWWSTAKQPTQPYSISAFGTPDLHALVAVLSKGPVAPGDTIGHQNASLIRSTARADGMLLRGDRPCLALDASLTPAFAKTHGAGLTIRTPPIFAHGTAELCDSATTLLVTSAAASKTIGVFTWRYIFAGDLREPIAVDLETGLGRPYTKESEHRVLYMHRAIQGYQASITSAPESMLHIIPPSGGDGTAYGFFVLAPVFSNGWVLLGELTKLVPISAARIKAIHVNSIQAAVETSALSVTVEGSQGEAVTMTAMPEKITTKRITGTCNVGESGHATFQFSESGVACLQGHVLLV